MCAGPLSSWLRPMQPGAEFSLKKTLAWLTANAQMGPTVVLWAPESGPKNVLREDEEDSTILPPKKPDHQAMLPYQLTLHGVMIRGNRQPSLQPLLQKGKHDSDRASPGVLSVRRTLLGEQVQSQGVSVSRRWCLPQSDAIHYLLG